MQIFLSVTFLFSAPLVGFLLQKLTVDENDLVLFYFPSLLWLLAVVASVFLTLNLFYAFVLIYFFVMMLIWFGIAKYFKDDESLVFLIKTKLKKYIC